MTKGYCVKCKTKREMMNVNVRKIRAWMASGNCAVCGTRMSRTMKESDALLIDALKTTAS